MIIKVFSQLAHDRQEGACVYTKQTFSGFITTKLTATTVFKMHIKVVKNEYLIMSSA